MALQASRKDLGAAALFVAIGAYFVLEAMHYDLGTPLRMGPGFMPVLLGSVLVLLGLAVAVVGLRGPDREQSQPFPWRGIVFILGSIVFFGVTLRGLGFVPTVIITAFATALSSRDNNWLAALTIAVALTVLCTLIFVVGLGLIVPWFGPWLRF